MKSSLLALAALLMLATPAAAMSVDHDSAYADSNGASRFSDPDDALANGSNGNGGSLGSVHFGNSDSSTGSVTFGVFATGNDQQLPPPGYYGGLQGSDRRN